MRRLLQTLSVLTLAACGDWPDPVIRSISPARMVATESTRIELEPSLALPTRVDYATGEIEVDTELALRIGSLEITPEGLAPDGRIAAVIPTLLQPGLHDVRLELEDGRVALLEDGFEVAEGAWPTGYTVDPIPDQRKLVPFEITIRAEGPNAAAFNGNVRFEAPAGSSIGPLLSDRFEAGVLRQTVVVNAPGNTAAIIVTDISGNRDPSAPFSLF
jgi:hypothetical protein